MRISRILVTGLLGTHNYIVPLNLDERITLIHGPNGCGKTVFLQILSALIQGRWGYLRRVPFDEFTVSFDDGGLLKVWQRPYNRLGQKRKYVVEMDFTPPGHIQPLHFRTNGSYISARPAWWADLQRAVRLRTIQMQPQVLPERVEVDLLEVQPTRVKLFTEKVNRCLRHKTLSIGSDGAFTLTSADNWPLPLEYLSGSERRELVLFYELLFQTRRDSLVLIDEPETSLDVDRQRSFLLDLVQIINLSACDVLLATHAPAIVATRRDLTVDLGRRGDAFDLLAHRPPGNRTKEDIDRQSRRGARLLALNAAS